MAIVTLLVVALVALLPELVRWQVQAWLERQPQIQASIGDVDINFFQGRVSVSNVEIEHSHERVLSLGEFWLELDWWPLWQHQLWVESAGLRQFQLTLTGADPTHLQLGPWQLSPDRTGSAKPDETLAPAWGIGWGRIELDQIEIISKLTCCPGSVQVESAQLGALASWLPKQGAALHSHVRVDQGRLTVSGQLQPFAETLCWNGTMTLEELPLARVAFGLQQAGIQVFSGTLSTDLACQLQWNAVSGLIADWQGDVSLAQLAVATQEVQLKRADLDWQGRGCAELSPGGAVRADLDADIGLDQLDLTLEQSGVHCAQQRMDWQGRLQMTFSPETPLRWQLGGTLDSSDLLLSDRLLQRQLLGWQHARLAGLAFSEQGMEIGQAQWQKLVALRPAPEASEHDPDLVRCQRLDLSQICWHFEPGRLTLNEILLSGLDVQLRRSATGQLNLTSWQPDSAVEEKNTTAPQQQPPEPGLSWALSSLRIAGDSRLGFRDDSTAPVVELEWNRLACRIGALDSALPQQPTDLMLEAEGAHGAALHAAGSLTLLAGKPDGRVTGSLAHLQLTELAPYLEPALGYRLERGELDLELDAPLQQGEVDLDSRVVLRGLALQPYDAQRQQQLEQSLGLPLPLALALLRDRQGDIRLDLPFSGPLDAPDLSLLPLVRTALVKAVQSAVQLTLAPVGVVFKLGASLLGDGDMLALPDVTFQPGSAEVAEGSQQKLDSVRQLLQQRPGLRLTLCSHVSQKDVEVLRPAGEAVAKASQSMDAALTRLVRARNQVVSDLLLSPGGALPGQLLQCQPRVEPEAGEPRVQLSF
ncbi:MAG: DUF748 domain-containing protein [Desulfuromonadaceae bacterium]|nr:DUF748 domain-containing protein [Desulfuromonadaceae bacterium]